MTPQERDNLIDDLLEDEISEADFLRLEAEFHADPDARKAYYDRLTLSTLLEVEAQEAHRESKIVEVDFRSSAKFWCGIAIAAAVVALVALAAGGVLWKNTNSDPLLTSEKEEPSATGFAVLSGTSEAVWPGDTAFDEGDFIPAGPIHLKSGIAQFDLFSGVTVVIEGEAKFEITSSMTMRLESGKLHAHVPPAARGFRVSTADGDVVDLGTQFAIDASSEQPEVHVLDGEVELHRGGKVLNLNGGEAVPLGTPEGAEKKAADPQKFVSPHEMDFLRGQRKAVRLQAWNQYVEQLKKDPRLLVYYPMGTPQDGPRSLANQAAEGSNSDLNGAIVAAKHENGRLGRGTAALDFSPAGSRVRVSIPGEHGSLTFFCWVKIDSLDRWFNSLFLTDGHELHEPHWQIMDDGRLFFSVKRRDGKGDKHVAYSPPFWNPTLGGKWLQIATVYDTENWTTTHYLNGEAISADHIPENMRVPTVKIGAASIGNWSEPKRDDPHFAVRNLNGAIDEFAIFSAALTADDIKELYQAGKP